MLVPCKLVDSDKHEIVVRLHSDNRVVFQNGCAWRVADAAERLSQLTTCKLAIDSMRAEIHWKSGQALAVSRCQRCDTLVVAHSRLQACPFCKSVTLDAPFWNRIVRVGRIDRRQRVADR